MKKALSTLLAFITFLVVFTAATPGQNKYRTNAERFKAGLGPLKPRNLFHPTRIRRAGDPVPSLVVPVQAVLKAYETSNPSNPVFLGYVSPNIAQNGNGYVGLTSDVASATIFNAHFASLQPVNIEFVNSPYGFPALGFVAAIATPDISLTEDPFALMAGTAETSPNSPPVLSSQHSFNKWGSTYMESAVWYLVDSTTLEVAPKWVNSDGTHITTPLFYRPGLNCIILSESVSEADSHGGYGGGTHPIKLYWDPTDVPV